MVPKGRQDRAAAQHGLRNRVAFEGFSGQSKALPHVGGKLDFIRLGHGHPVRIDNADFNPGRCPKAEPLHLLDPAALAKVGDWVIQSRDGAELLARAEAAASFGNGQPGL